MTPASWRDLGGPSVPEGDRDRGAAALGRARMYLALDALSVTLSLVILTSTWLGSSLGDNEESAGRLYGRLVIAAAVTIATFFLPAAGMRAASRAERWGAASEPVSRLILLAVAGLVVAGLLLMPMLITMALDFDPDAAWE